MATKFAYAMPSPRPELSPETDRAWDQRTVPHTEPLGFSDLGADAEGDDTIAGIAREFGITIGEIRYYEDNGLLRPLRDASSRSYGPRDRLHLKMILKGKALGLGLPEIRDILTARATDDEAREFETSELMEADLGAIARQPGRQSAVDTMNPDLAMALRPEQIVAQIDHLERQRKALDDAILVLREAHHRRVARDRCRPLR